MKNFLSEMEKYPLIPEDETAVDPVILSSPAKYQVANKKSVCLLKLTGINLLAFGLELCACAGFTYIPPILLKSGFSDENLTVIMGLGPLISFLLVPAISRWSDKCQSSFGRRRPFMLALGLLMILSLLIIPFSNDIFSEQSYILHPKFVSAVGVILLDFSSQALMNPCKSLIPDIFHSTEEQNSGFTAYSCMLSFGGCAGYFITSFDWTGTTLGIIFGGQEKAVFSLLAVLLVFLLGINLSIAKEEPFQRSMQLIPDLNSENCNELKSVNSTNNHEHIPLSPSRTLKNGIIVNHPRDNSHEARRYFFLGLKVRTSWTCIKFLFKRLLFLFLLPISAVIKYNFQDLLTMPKVLRHLFAACLFGWMGIMCHDMYYSDFVGQIPAAISSILISMAEEFYDTILDIMDDRKIMEFEIMINEDDEFDEFIQVIYKGEPHAGRESTAIGLYDEGVRMGSWGLLFHSLSAALYAAFLQQRLIHYFGMRKVYLFGMASFSISMFGTLLTENLILVNTFAAISGLGLAAITTIPCSLMTEYSKRKELQLYFVSSCRGVGEEMAVLDSAFYLAQIIPSFFLGYVVNYTKSSSTYMFAAALCGAAAYYVAYFVSYTSQSKSMS